MAMAVRRVAMHLASGASHSFLISGVNAHFVNVAQKDHEFARLLSEQDLNLADGASLVLASRLLGEHLPQRVTGIDLMNELCGLAAQTGKRVYLLGGAIGAATRAARNLQSRFPGLKIAGIDRPPMGREFDDDVVERTRDRIRRAHPDMLFVCFGVPSQEYWIHRFGADLCVPVVMGNGAALDVLAGFFHRPPTLIQNLNLEWLYRLLLEPRRLWRRYLLGNINFVFLIFRQILRNA